MANKVRSDDSYAKVEEVQDIAREIAEEEVGKIATEVRQEFILIFGVFASILIFLGIDVQVFQHAPRFSLIVGLSLFLLGSMIMFVFCLNNIIKSKTDPIKDYLSNPVIWFVGLCFVGAIISFIIGKY